MDLVSEVPSSYVSNNTFGNELFLAHTEECQEVSLSLSLSLSHSLFLSLSWQLALPRN